MQQKEGKAARTPFVTIKTSGYEQWIGDQASGHYRKSSGVWDEVKDVSQLLQKRSGSFR